MQRSTLARTAVCGAVLLFTVTGCATTARVLEEIDSTPDARTQSARSSDEASSTRASTDTSSDTENAEHSVEAGPVTIPTGPLTPDAYEQTLHAISDRLVAAKTQYCPLRPEGIMRAVFTGPENWEEKSPYETVQQYHARFAAFYAEWARSVVRDERLDGAELVLRTQVPVATERRRDAWHYNVDWQALRGDLKLFDYKRVYTAVNGRPSARVPILALAGGSGEHISDEGTVSVVEEETPDRRANVWFRVPYRQAFLRVSLSMSREEAERIDLLAQPLDIEVRTRITAADETIARGCSSPMAALRVEGVRIVSDGTTLYAWDAADG